MAVESGYTDFDTLLAAKWISRFVFRRINISSTFEPLGANPILQIYNTGKSNHWEAVLSSIPLEWHDLNALAAGLNNIGLLGKMAVQDPLFLAPGADGFRNSLSNGAVTGASQTGTTINCTFATSELIIKAGQRFNIGTQYFEATADATSDGAGAVAISFWPAIRTSPADSAVVDINDPHLHCRLLNMIETDIARATLAQPVAMAFKEDII